MWKRRIGAMAAVLALTVAAACGDDEGAPDPATNAGDTRSVTLYSGRNEKLVKPLLDMFTDDTGIEVQLRGGESGELAAQILTEGDRSPADVFFSQDAGALGAVAKAELLTKLPDDILTPVPAAFRAKDGTWVGTSGRVRVLVVNPALVPEPPRTIDELLDARWKGKLAFAPANASWQSFVTGLRLLRGEDGAKSWLEGFKAQDPKPYANNIAVRDAVDGGEAAIGLINHYYLYEKIAADGEDAVKARNQFLAPGDPGGLVNVAGAGVLASSEHQDEALDLVRFLVSPKAQRYFAERTFEYPLIDAVAPPAGLPTLASLEAPEVDLADLDSIEATQELLAEVGLLTT